MSSPRLTFRLATILALFFAVGCGDYSLFEEASYDDCIIESVAKAPNESAVELMRESCLRKFTIVKQVPLEVTQSLNSNNRITISNRSDYIVTHIAVDAGKLGEWEQMDWIEPHGWIDSDPPEATLEVVKAAKNGKVRAKSLRVIEVSEAMKK